MSVMHSQLYRPMVIFPAAEHHRSLANTQLLYCLLSEIARSCELYVQGHYVTADWLGFESDLIASLTPVPIHYTMSFLMAVN